MSRQNWEDYSVHTSSSSRYDPSHTTLRGGGSGLSRPSTPASSEYSEYMPPRRNTTPENTKTKKKKSNKTNTVTTQDLPHHKAGRVKVGIRIRPAFQDEISSSKTPFKPIITASGTDPSTGLGKVILSVGTGKQREFKFDYAFGPRVSQDDVYDQVAQPVVSDVLGGFNGTIFAYGQTGTGKTYTMGILETVNDDHAGIIPRSLSHIFQHLHSQRQVESTVSMSFVQIYRENIHDLLSTSIINGDVSNVVDENLAIREDPLKGFYVEGLQEYVVRSYEEAEALLNLGLENRAIASTLMNTTSSRSHTVITVIIEQKGNIPGSSENASSLSSSVYRVLRSKLLLVDLAGSERVRKTVSKGTRLDEAKSINTSLSALGNVIAALAESNTSHVPYRDSKLTKILHDSLGGTASTSLVATVGPVASHYNETLSTLQFGSRCMAVKSTPVQHEEVDFADMCARLKHQLATIEGQMNTKMNEQAAKYEATIKNLKEELQANSSGTSNFQSPDHGSGGDNKASLSMVLSYLSGHSRWDDNGELSWYKAASWIDSDGKPTQGTEASVLLAYCFDALKKMYKTTSALIEDSKQREKEQEEKLVKLLGEVTYRENIAELEATAMANCDPARHLDSFNFVGSHLAQISKGTAFARIKELYGLEGESIQEREETYTKENGEVVAKVLKDIADYTSAEELAKSIDFMTNKVGVNIDVLYGNIDKKDLVLGNLKTDLMSQMAEKRSREEEVVNWSYILKYLLATTSKLRSQLAEEQKRYADAQANNSPTKNFLMSPLKQGVSNDALKLKNREEIVEDDEKLTLPPRVPVQHDIGNVKNSSVKQKGNTTNDNSGNNTKLEGKTIIKNEDEQQPEQANHIKNIAVNNENMNSTYNRQERKRLSQAGKLGPRLQSSTSAVSHNAMTYSEIDQIGPPPSRLDNEALQTPNYNSSIKRQHSQQDFYKYDDDTSINDSDAAGSFRSAATVNSIPPYSEYPRKSGYESKGWMQNSRDKSRLPPTLPSSTNFAQNVVQGLGVIGEEAQAAVTVIERVSQMSNTDLARLDAETRQQVMQIRLELGIIDADDKISGISRPSTNSTNIFMRNSAITPGMYTPSSNITMSDDDDGFSQLDEDENWRY